jgi:integrase
MRSSGSKLPKYVYVQHIGKHTYYRFRKGKRALRLPGHPGSPEFHAAYAKQLIEAPADDGRYTENSVAHVIEQYLKSSRFSDLALGSQRDYRRYLARLDQAVGSKPIEAIDSQFVAGVIDKLKDTPSAANHALAVMRTFFKFAQKRKLIEKDPTQDAERLAGGDSYERWSDAAIQQFRASASPTMRLALELGLATAQRLGDVIALRWSDYDGRVFKLVQQKTGTAMVIPVHPDLAKLLKQTERRAETILTTKTGRPYHPRVFSRDFRDARIAAGLPVGLSFHGLRHTTASILAEQGVAAQDIQAVTGHKSLKLVEHYIRQANQRLQAERAISKLPGFQIAKRKSK